MIVLTRKQCEQLEQYIVRGGDPAQFDRIANHTVTLRQWLKWRAAYWLKVVAR